MMIVLFSFDFQRWVPEYNENYREDFITENALDKYRIDRFTTSGMFYLLYSEKKKYIEVATKLNLNLKSNISKLIATFDKLIEEEML